MDKTKTSFKNTDVKGDLLESFNRIEGQLKDGRRLLSTPITFESCENLLLRITELKLVLNHMERILLETHFESCIIPYLKAPTEIVLAVHNLSTKRFGALIVIEGETKLDVYIKTGVIIDAEVSAPLLESIFYPGNPLHDGAVIVRENRIIAAKTLLPVAVGHRASISNNLGTRHRAAVGLSEITDALVIVVSEETGQISLAVKGQLHYGLGIAMLRRHLSTI
jgi:uncharacterized protein (TIGR00159 family)